MDSECTYAINVGGTCEKSVRVECHGCPLVRPRIPSFAVGVALLLVGLLFTFAQGFGFNSWMNGFHMDDVVAIQKNLDVVNRNSTDWEAFLRHDFWGLDMFSGEWTHKSFRPLTTMTYRWNWLMSGIDTSAYHITNIVGHNVVTLLVVVLARASLGFSLNDSIIAGALFAVHPVHTESVLYLVGRADILCAIFMVASIILYQKSNGVISYMLTIFGGLSKELGFMAFPVFVLMDFLAQRSWRRMVLTGAVGFALLATRFWYTDGTYLKMSPQDNPISFEEDNLGRWLSYSLVHGEYMRLLLVPVFLCYDYSLNTIPLACWLDDMRLLAPLGAYSIFFGLAHFALAKRDARLLLLGGWFLAAFLPMSNIFFPIGTVVGERLLYIPSIPFVLLLVVLVPQTLRGGMNCPGKVFILFLFCAWFTRAVCRVDDWRTANNLTLVDGARNPNSAKTQYNLAVQFFTKQKYDLAYEAFVRSFETDEQRRDGIAYWRAGQVEILRGNLRNAEKLLVAATSKYGAKLMVREEEIFHDAGIASFHNGHPEMGFYYLSAALQLNRRFPKALNNLGCLYATNRNDLQNGLALVEEAAAIKSRSVIYWGNVWIIAGQLGDMDTANSAKEHVLKIQPSFVPNVQCVWEFKPAEGGPGDTAESD